MTPLQKARTWFPILAGVLLGIVMWLCLAALESPSFCRLTVWIFKETDPKNLYAIPAYYCVHRTLLLLFAVIGGSIGIRLSTWPIGKSALLLLSTIVVIAIFAAFGFH